MICNPKAELPGEKLYRTSAKRLLSLEFFGINCFRFCFEFVFVPVHLATLRAHNSHAAQKNAKNN